MRRVIVSMIGVAVLIGAIWLPVGCVGFGGKGFDFIKMMTCRNDPIESEGDLAFSGLTLVVPSVMPMPGDIVNFTYTVVNNAPQGTPNANIGMPSNMKLFMSFNNRIGPNSYLFGDIPISGINAGQTISEMTTLSLPRPSAEPQTEDVAVGTGNLDGETLTTNQDTTFILNENDWVIVRGPAPNFNEAYLRITEEVVDGDVYTIEGTHPDGPVLNNAQLIKTDRPKYFPYLIADVSPTGGIEGLRDPNSPNYIGPERITYQMIAVLDAQNCVIEANEPTTPEFERYDENDIEDGAGQFGADYDPNDARLNNQAIIRPLTLLNPNLPNLTIGFVDRQPTTDIPQTGGVVMTRWEISNDGISPVTTPFLTRIYFSENESYAVWDPHVQQNNWPRYDDGGDIRPVPYPHGLVDIIPDGPYHPYRHAHYEVTTIVPGNSNVFEIINVAFPFYQYRSNQYTAVDISALFQWIGGGSPGMEVNRQPPPLGPPGWWFAVYLPIPSIGGSSNYLIGEVDAQDPFFERFEAGVLPGPWLPFFGAWFPDPLGPLLPDEFWSDRVRESNEYDNFSHLVQNGNGNIEVGFENEMFPLDTSPIDLTVVAARTGSGYWADLRYDNENPSGPYSVGFYFSQDDTLQSADWFWNRFWWTLQTGQSLTEDQFFPVFADVPSTGSWHFGAVVDDVFRYGKRYNDNNHVMATGTVTIQ